MTEPESPRGEMQEEAGSSREGTGVTRGAAKRRWDKAPVAPGRGWFSSGMRQERHRPAEGRGGCQRAGPPRRARPVAEPPRRSLGANQRPRHGTAARAHARCDPPIPSVPPLLSPEGRTEMGTCRAPGKPRCVRPARGSALCVGPPRC